MCIGCWQDAGSPMIISEEIRELALQARSLDHFGALHIVIEDWNIDDDCIAHCMEEEDIGFGELIWAEKFMNLADEKLRASVLAYADGYWGEEPSPSPHKD